MYQYPLASTQFTSLNDGIAYQNVYNTTYENLKNIHCHGVNNYCHDLVHLYFYGSILSLAQTNDGRVQWRKHSLLLGGRTVKI